ncbi:hypothetical protein CASFOL_037843 [Castilleja foliolosa]|uniref:Uncharacterized protein n=1 Tax=Castilleja foliolosa TaxID=1961234 RepID=A0ABD3BL96_9LAMI
MEDQLLQIFRTSKDHIQPYEEEAWCIVLEGQSAAFHSMGSFDRMNPFDRMVFVRSNGPFLQSSSPTLSFGRMGFFHTSFDRMKSVCMVFVALLLRSVLPMPPMILDLEVGPEKVTMDDFSSFLP